jgi:hypothetical protein
MIYLYIYVCIYLLKSNHVEIKILIHPKKKKNMIDPFEVIFLQVFINKFLEKRKMHMYSDFYQKKKKFYCEHLEL